MPIPSVELLEATHRFPGPYIYKAIGNAEGNFKTGVLGAVRAVLDLAVDPPYRARHTDSRKHVAITLELKMESAQQVVELYQELLKVEGLVLLL